MGSSDRRPEATKSDFVEALARGLDVISSFGPMTMEQSVSDVAARTALARPTARRLLITLEQLGYVRSFDGAYSLTTRVLRLGTAGIAAQGLWDVARPHLQALVRRTGESSSMSQLDGSDIVYIARVPVPKIIAFSVNIGTLFPAVATSMGRVLLSELDDAELDDVLETESRSGIIPRIVPERTALMEDLATIRECGWALSDEQLSVGVRSVATAVRNPGGHIEAAMNVTVHAGETSIERLTEEYLPHLLDAAKSVTDEWADFARLPVTDSSESAD